MTTPSEALDACLRLMLRAAPHPDDAELWRDTIRTASIILDRQDRAAHRSFWRWGTALWILLIAALIAVGWCVTPVLAEPRVTVHHDAGPHDGWFARLEVLNLFGVYNQVEVLETTHGPVSIEYATSLPHALNDPASADTACVVDLPDGVVALPPCVNVLERETGTIFLHDFLGG